MNTFKAFRIKTGTEIKAGDIVRNRRGTCEYRFSHVASNGNVVTLDPGEPEFQRHPGDLHDVMVRDVAPKQPAPVDPVTAVFGDYHSIDSKHIKSYATKKALAQALVKMGATRENGINALAVCTSDGRHTAIIGVAGLQGNLTMFPGFMKFG